MPDFLHDALAQDSSSSPVQVLVRLLVALLLGLLVAWIYDRSTPEQDNGVSFPLTLVLLTVLIAMVTQVIGDNIARAFSLVGALSIVRFRTVVRDTRDTAFVIFAVVVGMAVGAAHLWVALLGLAVVGTAAPLLASRGQPRQGEGVGCMLRMRLGLGVDMEARLGALLDRHLQQRHLQSVATDRSGAGLDYVFYATLRSGHDMTELLRELSLVEGVQDLRCELRMAEGGR
ncbi:MAG: DUF4956 domain-containing protein [Steroidobacteraceae bacterium]